MPGGLHRHAAGHGAPHRLGRLECGQAEEARARYGFHQFRVQREQHENDERLAEKAQAKLADLAQHSRHTDPSVLEAKRAVVEAALARARAKREAGP